jgi:putative hydrolase of the HAD superfamily
MNEKTDIQAVIWDIGNVLLNLDFPKAHRFFINKSGLSKEIYFKTKVLCPENIKRFETGQFSGLDFFRQFCEELQIDMTLAEFYEVWNDIFEVNRHNCYLMEKCLRGNIECFALTNTNSIHLPFITANYPFFQKLKGIVASYEVGLVKPDPDIFHFILSQYQLEPGKTIFVDDRIENVAAAKNLGIWCFHYVFNDLEFYTQMQKWLPDIF